MQRLTYSLVFVFAVNLFCLLPISNACGQSSPIIELEKWLAEENKPPIENQSWATSALSKQDAGLAADLLWKQYVAAIGDERKQEWNAKQIQLDQLEMKFDYRVFGEPDNAGRSLFISMHGGGGTAARVNDQQWKNQIGLYRPAEGVYLAPRAPTNTWNLWHQPHIDKFFQRIIQDAVVFEGVDPNRVYIMGYSAGGDGVYQLAPRMADRWAAAAMMAGHPNDASPANLRNIGFTLHMGANDGAYNRNGVATEWKAKLAKLQKSDPQGYQHEVTIHQGKGHWMDRQDAVAVPWMAKFKRNPIPQRVVWQQSSVLHNQFYWLAVDESNRKPGSKIVATYKGNEVEIEQLTELDKVRILLDDRMVDLDQPVVIKKFGRQVFAGKTNRTIQNLADSLAEKGDRELMFAAAILVNANP